IWFDEIKAALGRTSVAVMLVTPAFIASDFIDKQELGPLLKEAVAGGVRILWVLIRDCSCLETPLKDYQAVVSPPGNPLASMTRAKRDSAWRKVCEAIKRDACRALDSAGMASTNSPEIVATNRKFSVERELRRRV